MDISMYLARIGHTGDASPTAENLAALQFAHLCSVPYENLDILAGIPLSLEAEALFDKIVRRRRGGYCFELNELFGHLLRALGYGVEDYFARFLLGEAEVPKRRHHVLGVTIPGKSVRYLADVGVGVGSPNYPVRMTPGEEQPQGDKAYRFHRDDFLGWVLDTQKDGAWLPLFSFTEEKQLPQDFQAISFFCEKAETSPFNKEPMVAMRTPGGRCTLDGNVFKRFEGETVTAWEEATEAARDETLLRLFGIRPPAQGLLT